MTEIVKKLKEYEQRYSEYEESYHHCEWLAKQISKCKEPFQPKKQIETTFRHWAGEYIIFLFALSMLLVIIGILDIQHLRLLLVIYVVSIVSFFFIRKASIQKQNDRIFSENAKKRREWSQRQQSLLEYQSELEAAEAKQVCLLQKAAEQRDICGLVGDYSHPSVVHELIHYLEVGRSDTLKEAINLFESEKELKRHHQQMEYSAAQAVYFAEQSVADNRRAADSAEEAAFWAAASAFAAANASRQQKSNENDYRVI